MKKIPSLFTRKYENGQITGLTEEFTNSKCQDALEHGTATVKLDGTACCIINGELYARYDAKLNKNGVPKPIPEDATPCCDRDPVTGHMPCWVPVKDKPAYKWHRAGLEKYLELNGCIKDGTYELIGKHEMGDPYNLGYDILIPHGKEIIPLTPEQRTFTGITALITERTDIEGIVFWLNNEPVAKIKRTDLCLEWNGSTKKRHN